MGDVRDLIKLVRDLENPEVSYEKKCQKIRSARWGRVLTVEEALEVTLYYLDRKK